MIYLTNEIINIKIRLIKSCKKINSSIIGELASWRPNWPQFIITSILKVHPLLKIVNGSLVELPSPSNINSLWNFGSLLGLCLIIQILTGIFLAMHYSGDIQLAFYRVNHISRDVNFGWLLRIIHANGARFFFICLFIHIGRGLYYGSYFFTHTWIIGVVILLMVIATAFLGYVLPWGQISFWGATVITNLFSAIPYIGGDLVIWIWGGFAVDNATLTRFFSLHFLLPFIIAGLRIVHLLFLHQTGRNNPLGINRNFDKILFHPYFSSKDLFGFIVIIILLITICFFMNIGRSWKFYSCQSFSYSCSYSTWMIFFKACAILRSISNKLGGVITLAISIIILLICLFIYKSKFRGFMFYHINKIYFWIHINIWVLLTWLGACPVEGPYILLGQILSIIYYFLGLSTILIR